MAMIVRLLSGVIGLTILVGTVVLALKLLAMEPDASVYLAGYMGIGCIMLSAYFLLYAIAGEWRPNRTRRKKEQ